jgi:hypothetical protein
MEALGYGVSRYLLMNSDKDLVFPILDLKIKLQRDCPMEFQATIPIESLDLFVKVRTKMQNQSQDEFALISLVLDSILNLRDEQIQRFYNIRRNSGIMLTGFL